MSEKITNSIKQESLDFNGQGNLPLFPSEPEQGDLLDLVAEPQKQPEQPPCAQEPSPVQPDVPIQPPNPPPPPNAPEAKPERKVLKLTPPIQQANNDAGKGKLEARGAVATQKPPENKPGEAIPSKSISAPVAQPAPSPQAPITAKQPVKTADKPVERAPEKKEKKLTTESKPHTIPRKTSLSRGEDSLGSLLLEARRKVGYSIAQVAGTTRINAFYIEALERDDYDSVPPAIYARAYVKKLCATYGVPEEEGLKRLKQNDGSKQHVPDVVLQTLEEHKQVNIEEETKVERTAWLFMGVLIVLIVVCVIAGTILWQGYFKSPRQKPSPGVVDRNISKEMEKLVAPQQLMMSPLPFPE